MKKKTKILVIVAVVILIALVLLSIPTGLNPVYALLSHVIYPEYFDYSTPLDWSVEEIYEFYYKYDEEWIIGKTSEEIEEEYGSFDGKYWDKNGHGTGTYTILERGYLGGDYIFFIEFENHVAVNAYGKFVV